MVRRCRSHRDGVWDVKYTIKDGKFCVVNEVNGTVEWEGQISGHDIFKVLPIAGSNDCIALLSWYPRKSRGDFENVVRCRPNGSVIWHAQLPSTGYDYYTGLTLQRRGK